jgi:hypothetical protein
MHFWMQRIQNRNRHHQEKWHIKTPIISVHRNYKLQHNNIEESLVLVVWHVANDGMNLLNKWNIGLVDLCVEW